MIDNRKRTRASGGTFSIATGGWVPVRILDPMLDLPTCLWTTGANVIKLFSAVSYDFLLSTRGFVFSKLFQPSLFAGKVKAYPSEVPVRYSTLG
jgi:hypothetical protein